MIGIDDATLAERRRCAEAVASMQNQRHAYRVVTGDPKAELPKKHWAVDVIDAHIQRGITNEAALTNAFTEWLQQNAEVWPFPDAPERLAAIAVEWFARLRR